MYHAMSGIFAFWQKVFLEALKLHRLLMIKNIYYALGNLQLLPLSSQKTRHCEEGTSRSVW